MLSGVLWFTNPVHHRGKPDGVLDPIALLAMGTMAPVPWTVQESAAGQARRHRVRLIVDPRK